MVLLAGFKKSFVEKAFKHYSFNENFLPDLVLFCLITYSFSIDRDCVANVYEQ
jgi:hypothetical protein